MGESLTENPGFVPLPCPFCGLPPTWYEGAMDDNHWFGCMTEDCVGPYITDTDREYILKLWNTRAPT